MNRATPARRVARRLVQPFFDRVERRVGPIDTRVAELEARVQELARRLDHQDTRKSSNLLNAGDLLGAWIDERFQREVSADEAFYEPLTPLQLAAHERRMQLLDNLPIADPSDAVCVDYGCGSWGFAAVFPRIQCCRFAIGVDISPAALEASTRISTDGTFAYADHFQYVASNGTYIPIPDATADLVFCGESIEHVDNSDAFLDEIHRILRPGGQLVMTTPNADAELYRARDERFCVGPEHSALMSYDELCGYLKPRFSVVTAKGLTASRYPDLDNAVTDAETAREYVRMHEDRPDLASNVVCLLSRVDDYRPLRHHTTIVNISDSGLRCFGRWDEAPLAGPLVGLLAEGTHGETLEFDAEAAAVVLQFWASSWGGIAEVRVAGQSHELNLYEPVGGFRRFVLRDLPRTTHRVTIRATGRRDRRSVANQVVFYRALTDLTADRAVAS